MKKKKDEDRSLYDFDLENKKKVGKKNIWKMAWWNDEYEKVHIAWGQWW